MLESPEPLAKFHPQVKFDNVNNILRLPYTFRRINNNDTRHRSEDISTLISCKEQARIAINTLEKIPVKNDLVNSNITYFSKMLSEVDKALQLTNTTTNAVSLRALNLNQQPATNPPPTAIIESIQKKLQTPSHMGLKTELSY